MKRETKQHLIYTLVIILIISGVVWYEHNETKETRKILTQEISKLSNQVSSLQNQLNEKIQQLKGNITDLNMNLEDRETEIKSLTGELAQVKVENKQQVDQLQENIKKIKAQNQDFSSVIEDAIPSVISVRTNVGSGSGFIIQSNGYAVTNYHVIEDATAGNAVTSDGKSHTIRIVGFNKNADIAVLELSGEGFPKLRFGSSNNLDIGERVIAVGSPGGLDFTVTQGIVSAQRTENNGNELVQIDVPINPGNSGGPLINSAGKVVGVNTKKISGFEGVGFALASSYVDDIVDEIIVSDVPESK